jgi:hypothetical protein
MSSRSPADSPIGTFPTEILADIAVRLIAEDAAVALQYSATEGLAGYATM